MKAQVNVRLFLWNEAGSGMYGAATRTIRRDSSSRARLPELCVRAIWASVPSALMVKVTRARPVVPRAAASGGYSPIVSKRSWILRI